ncbi:MAG: hypothetical protein NT075_18575, partial [Chloroflexi bacterium]|nr:hypothetical protein [Chloroflexota bacterium]
STSDVPSMATIKSGAPLFSDDFRRDSKQWRVDSGQDDVTFAYSQRAFHIKVDAPQTFTWSTGNVTVTNFLAELDAQFVAGTPDVEAGLIFGLVDEENYQLFAIKKSGQYALLKKVAGEWETLVDWTASTAIDTREEAVNHLGVLAANSTITLMINDEALETTPDESLGTGQIGLAVGTADQPGAEVAFDNVKLWAVK